MAKISDLLSFLLTVYFTPPPPPHLYIPHLLHISTSLTSSTNLHPSPPPLLYIPHLYIPHLLHSFSLHPLLSTHFTFSSPPFSLSPTLCYSPILPLHLSLDPTLSRSHSPSIPLSLNPPLPQSHSPSIPLSLDPTFPQSTSPSIPLSLDPTLPQSHSPSIPLSLQEKAEEKECHNLMLHFSLSWSNGPPHHRLITELDTALSLKKLREGMCTRAGNSPIV